ncbi:MAG: MalY/PatB family protein [bacterium]|jgi:cystathionine beta-lyase
MKYDFDQVIDRSSTYASKWCDVEEVFGSKDVLPMWIADMDLPVPVPVVEALIKRAEHGIYGYTSRPESYYVAFANWMEKRHGFKIAREWIAHAPGVIPPLNLLVAALTRPGDKIVLQSPAYPPFYEIIDNNGCHLVNNPLKLENGRYVMDYENLERALQEPRVKIFLLCSPHNPVGRVWTKEELIRAGELCLANDVLVLADEIHCDLIYSGHKHIPFASISEEFAQNSVTFVAPSKTFNLAGLQTAVAIIPNSKLYALYQQILADLHMKRNNIFGMVAAEAAYSHGAEWLDQLMEYLQGNLDFVLRYFAERIPKIKANRPEGTYLVWLDCRELGLPHGQLQQFMVQKARVAMNDGMAFGVGGEGFLRLNIACPRSMVEEALQRIEQAVNSL